MSLPVPACEAGYTDTQLAAILGDRLQEFKRWMNGQTVALCDGRRYDHGRREYEPACGGVAHGAATYPWDLERFLDGRPIVD